MKSKIITLSLLCLAIAGCTKGTLTDNVQQTAIERLKAGNERFINGKSIHQNQTLQRVKDIKDSQKPFAVIISCSDSRVSPEIVFDQGLGDLFVIRTAGNVLHDYELGSIEYAVEHLNVKTIYVLGHKNCGAVKAMLGEDNGHPLPGHIHSIIEGLKSEPEVQEAIKNKAQSKDLTEDAVEANIKFAIKQISTSEPLLKEKFEKKEVEIFGGVYNLDNGQINQLTN